MRKGSSLAFLSMFILLAFAGYSFGQELYKWVDEKGTLHFTDNPTYAKSQQQKEQPKENGIEVLKKSEASKQPATDPSGKRIIINYSQGAGGSGGSGGSSGGSVSSGRS